MNLNNNSNRYRMTTLLVSLCGLLLIWGCGGGKYKPALPPVSEETKASDSTQAGSTDGSQTAADTANQEQSGWVIKDLINVRSKASTSSDVVAQLSRGSEVKLIEYTDKWWKVQLTDGRTAYVFETLLTKERYVDPWTRFKFEASRVDDGLKIISGVSGIDGDAPSAALTVSSDEWASVAQEARFKTAESAYKFWGECLKKCGYDPVKSIVIIRDQSEKELARVTTEGGRPMVTMAE